MPRFSLLPATALLVLAIGCGSGDDSTAPGDGEPTGQVPPELVGRWRAELILDQTCDPNTGVCTPTSAQSETLSLTTEGRFEHVVFAESNFPPCDRVLQHQSEGTAEVQETTLALHITEGLTRFTDSCGQNSETDESGETDIYTWQLTEGESGGQELMLTNELGTVLGPFELQP